MLSAAHIILRMNTSMISVMNMDYMLLMRRIWNAMALSG